MEFISCRFLCQMESYVMIFLQDDDDEDWCDDTDAEAVARRMESLTSGAKGLMLNDDLEKSPQERLDLFYEFVKVFEVLLSLYCEM